MLDVHYHLLSHNQTLKKAPCECVRWQTQSITIYFPKECIIVPTHYTIIKIFLTVNIVLREVFNPKPLLFCFRKLHYYIQIQNLLFHCFHYAIPHAGKDHHHHLEANDSIRNLLNSLPAKPFLQHKGPSYRISKLFCSFSQAKKLVSLSRHFLDHNPRHSNYGFV